MDVSAILSGITIGTVTLSGVIRAALLTAVGMAVIRILLNIVDKALERSKNLVDLRVYIRSIVKILLWFVLVLMVAPSLGIDVTSLVALLSVAGLAVSLALQNTLSNLAGGIMVLLTKPFAVGDFIESEGISGTVSGVDLAYTAVVTSDNKEVFVPNSHIAAAKIVNYNRLGKRRVELKFNASYEAPTARVKDAITQVLDTLPQIMADPAPVIYLAEYQTSSIQYVVRVWTTTEDFWDVYYAIQEGVRESFARNQVEMTYDHLNVHLVEK